MAILDSYDDGAGDAFVAVKRTETGAVNRTQHQKNADLTSTADFDTLVNAKAAAGNGVLLDPTQGKFWLLGGKSPTFDEASGVLSRLLAVDNQGNAVTIPDGKQAYWARLSQTNGQPNDYQVGNGSIYAGYAYYLRATSGSHAASNLYGVIGNVHNAGPGSTKAIYGRGVVDATCTGVVMGGVFGVNTHASASPSNTTIVQLTADSVGGTRINYGVWVGSNETLGYLQYGLLFDNKIDVTQAFVQAFANRGGGAGDFLRLKSSDGNSDLFRVDKDGAIAALVGGIKVDLAFAEQKALGLTNNARAYQLQAVNSGDYFRILIGSVGDGFILTANLNTGLSGQNSFGGGARVIAIPDATTVPNSNPSGGGILYCEAGALKFRGSGGTVTTLGNA